MPLLRSFGFLCCECYKDIAPTVLASGAGRKTGLVENLIQRLAATGQIVLLGLFHQFVQPSSLGISVNLLVPKLLAQFLKPVGDFMNLLRLQFLDGRFDFLNRAHGTTLIQPKPPCNGLFSSAVQSGHDEIRCPARWRALDAAGISF